MADKKVIELVAMEKGFSGNAQKLFTTSGKIMLTHKAVDGKSLCGVDVTVITNDMRNAKITYKRTTDAVDCGRCLKAIAQPKATAATPKAAKTPAKAAPVKKAAATKAAPKSAGKPKSDGKSKSGKKVA